MSEVKVDTISERTAANGVAVDGVTIKDSGLTIPSGGTLTVASGGTITNSGTATGFGGDNTPGFHANRSSGQGMLDATFTLIYFNSETYDSNSAYGTGTGRFTVPSGEGGKYFVYSGLVIYSGAGAATNDIESAQLLLKKNGSNGGVSEFDPNTNGYMVTLNLSCTLDLAAADYLEVFGYMNTTSGNNATVAGDAYPRSYFGAYKLIGV